MEKESGYDISAEREPSGQRTGGGSPVHAKMKPSIMKGTIKKGDTCMNKDMYKKDGIKDSGKNSY